jgi:aspartate racemase
LISREVWGVVGGMGPLASAEFLKSIYEASAALREQDAPSVILLSDPGFPDRTETLLDGGEDILLGRLRTSLDQLLTLGATRIIICCTTMHHVLSRLESGQRVKILSLVDVIMGRLLSGGGRRLLLCTEGSRRVRLFESHPLWARVAPYVVMPREADQRRVHGMIYELKSNRRSAAHAVLLEDFSAKYGVRGFVAGCTEIHLIAKYEASNLSWLDPLAALASEVAGGPAAIPTCDTAIHA